MTEDWDAREPFECELRILTNGEDEESKSEDYVSLTISLQIPREKIVKRVISKTMDSFFGEIPTLTRKEKSSVLCLGKVGDAMQVIEREIKLFH
jgi:hypothetical protein